MWNNCRVEGDVSALETQVSALKNKPSVSESELSVLEDLETAQEPQPLIGLQKALKVARTKSKETRKREKKWVNNVRILTDDSLPIKE